MTADNLTRRAIIAAHDADCGCGPSDVDAHSSPPPLTKREEAIVAQWRADVETTSVVHECCEARQSAEAELAKATSAVERVETVLAEWNRLGRGDGVHGVQIREALAGTEDEA